MPSKPSSSKSLFNRDLKSTKWIYAKGAGFLIIILMCFGVLIFDEVKWRRAFLGLCLIWSSARFYYFLFYVIEKYVDPNFKFSGVWSAVQYLLKGNHSRNGG